LAAAACAFCSVVKAPVRVLVAMNVRPSVIREIGTGQHRIPRA
jgi:hypothetical protein